MASRKVFYYRGYSIEELQKMTMDDLIALLPSRQRRSLTRKMPASHIKLMEKIQKRKDKNPKPIRTHLRDFIVLPNLVGMQLQVYNGREFVKVKILPESVGHYLGEFSPTCKIVRHSAPGIGATRSSQYVPLK